MMERDDVPTSTVALVSVIGVLTLVVILLGLDVLYRRVAAWQASIKDMVEPRPSVAAAQAEEQSLLTQYRLVDAKNGVVRIPIQRAMELVVAELSAMPSPSKKQPLREGSHGKL